MPNCEFYNFSEIKSNSLSHSQMVKDNNNKTAWCEHQKSPLKEHEAKMLIGCSLSCNGKIELCPIKTT